MTIICGLLRWIGRHALLFALIVAAMLAFGQWQSTSREADGLAARAEALTTAVATLEQAVAGHDGKPVTALDAGARWSQRAVAQRQGALITERAAILRGKPDGIDLLTAPRETIVAGVSADIRIELIDQELAFLKPLLPAAVRVEELKNAIATDADNLAALADKTIAERYVIEDGRIVDLAAYYQQRQTNNRRKLAAELARQAQPPLVDSARLEALLQPVRIAATTQGAALAATLPATAERWYQKLAVDQVLWPAFWTLLGIVAAPFVIRTLFYYGLAPLAGLGRPIRLLEPGVHIPEHHTASHVSISIALAPGEELLVKQDYLQSSAGDGVKATQLLLDGRFPLSSIASGLLFLTRIRSGGRTTVSATRDAFAELALLDLPAGAACVVQPRAIVGVVQAIDSPLRITSHWRLGTINAWLTWQWRFLVFHGPARLILKGGRGVRIEPAESGRNIGQDQLIGFSAGIATSSTRTETFLPYLIGREPLLNDRIAAGDGVLIAEEAPLAGRRGGGRRGLEGAMDAALKLFGI